MPSKIDLKIRKAAESDVEVGLICADRDGNRIRVDRIESGHESAGELNDDVRMISYHFLNDELRVQEGVQERSMAEFLAEGWYIAGKGSSL
jgi:hypothetical protein